MSSINTSNSISVQAAILAGKRATDPNASPLRSAHDNAIRSKSGDEQNEGKVATNPKDLLRRAGSSDTAIFNDRVASPNPREAKALDTAQKLVSTTLIKPILAQARETRDAPAPWGQTQGEKQFGSLLDNRIADDIARASNFPIAQRIAEQILKNSPIDSPSTIQHTPVDLFG